MWSINGHHLDNYLIKINKYLFFFNFSVFVSNINQCSVDYNPLSGGECCSGLWCIHNICQHAV